MAENSFGANIIEILTAGMYQDSKVIYREYIQNACDQIDKAEQWGILNPRNTDSKYPDLGQGVVNIWLKPEERYIAIEDNATGIKADDFQRTLLTIADSDKIMGEDKGFRGIGRLCGLAYCKHLIFTSRWSGEDVVSIMSCDAQKMREMINETNTKVKRHSADDVINAITTFNTRSANSSDPEHFFKVELININEENEELFGGIDEDNIEQLSNYLSFVAPVPYNKNFIYRKEIYDHAKSLNVRIDEYDIRINGKQIFKEYKTKLKVGNVQDEVFGVQFHDFFADDGSLLGWMWFGKMLFKAAIKEEEISRGLRLRKENIQIGHDGTLRDMFTREASRRGNNYFIGEIFVTSRELIPNSQRSYFNENPTRIEFEHKMKDYFNNTLYHIYYEGSRASSRTKKIKDYNEKVVKFDKKVLEGDFITPEELEREEYELKKAEQLAEKAQKDLEKQRSNNRSILTNEIISRRADVIPTIVKSSTDSIKNEKKDSSAGHRNDVANQHNKKDFLVDKIFPQANEDERKLLFETLDKILVIIRNSTDKKTSEEIVSMIREELKNIINKVREESR